MDAPGFLHNAEGEGAQRLLEHLTEGHRIVVFVEEVHAGDGDACQQVFVGAGEAGGDVLHGAAGLDARGRDGRPDDLGDGDEAALRPREAVEDGEVREGQFDGVSFLITIWFLVEFRVEGAAPVELPVAIDIHADGTGLDGVEVEELAVCVGEEAEGGAAGVDRIELVGFGPLDSERGIGKGNLPRFPGISILVNLYVVQHALHAVESSFVS